MRPWGTHGPRLVVIADHTFSGATPDLPVSGPSDQPPGEWRYEPPMDEVEAFAARAIAKVDQIEQVLRPIEQKREEVDAS